MSQATLLKFDRSRVRRIDRKVGFHDTAELTRVVKPETPVFCFSAAALEKQAQLFLNRFPGEVAFAVKSNGAPEVISALSRAGIKVWDVASVEEMALVSAWAPAPVFHYHNPVKSLAEVRIAYETYGCRRYAVDCIEELNKLSGVLPRGTGIEIAVRFVLPRAEHSSAHDFSAKFGAPAPEAARLLKNVNEAGFVPVLTFHPGSQCTDPGAYARHIRAAAEIESSSGVKISVLNVGGGFPARYARSGADLQKFFESIDNAAIESFGRRSDLRLECEPGRGIVASCMSLLAKVKLVRQATNEVFLNDGVYGGLMEFWQVPALQPPHRVIRDGQVIAICNRPVRLYGPTCDPLDRLPEQVLVPSDIHESDYIEFGNLGAYGIATVTRFNGYGQHEIVPVEHILGS